MSYSIATSIVDTRAVINAVIEDAWTSLGYAASAIDWPNQHFLKPGNTPYASGPWVRVSYTDQSTVPLTYGQGGTLNDSLCVLQLQVFASRNTGDAVMHAICDKFRASFERQSFGAGIYFRNATGPQVIDDPAWAGRLLSLPFSFFEAINV